MIKCKKGDKEFLLSFDSCAFTEAVLAKDEKDAAVKVALLQSDAIIHAQREADEEHKDFSYEVIVSPF